MYYAVRKYSFHFFFLPAFLLLYYLIPINVWRNSILLFISLIFFCWTDLPHLPQLISFVLINFTFGILIDRCITTEKQNVSRMFVWIAVSLDLLGLIFYKYLGFLGNTITAISSISLHLPSFTLPLGISYLTFSAISYILDVYHRTISPEKNLLRFSSYLIMFPKLVQGPITRFGQVKENLCSSQRINLPLIMIGTRRFIGGWQKKCCLLTASQLLQIKYSMVLLSKWGLI